MSAIDVRTSVAWNLACSTTSIINTCKAVRRLLEASIALRLDAVEHAWRSVLDSAARSIALAELGCVAITLILTPVTCIKHTYNSNT